ncbi:MAG: response regulator transcription factor [Candidatus Acidiferrales bacterium]
MFPSPAHVLVVDDSPLMRRMVCDLLESESGFTIVGEAENGQKAVQRAKKLLPDLVILDLAMPSMNGLEAASALKRAIPDLRIILFTLYGDPDVERTARSMGIDAVISKENLERLGETARRLVDG